MTRAIVKAAARNLARVRDAEHVFAGSQYFAPEPGEVVTLPGGLTAFAGDVPEPGEPCEMCAQMIVGACYLIPIGGGYTVVHAACLGECR